MAHDAVGAGCPPTPAAIRRPDAAAAVPGDGGASCSPDAVGAPVLSWSVGGAWAAARGTTAAATVPARWQRRRRRIAAAAAAALAVGAAVLFLGIALDRGGALGVASGMAGGAQGGMPRAALLQEGLEDADDMLRDDMLASAPAPTQALSWLDWSEDDIEREETIIKQKLITIEQNLIAQPQKLNEMKVALGKVEEYYGKNGKLREGVPDALTSVRKQMQRAEDDVMNSERMRRLTADIRAVRVAML
jgi:hypothetical protein